MHRVGRISGAVVAHDDVKSSCKKCWKYPGNDFFGVDSLICTNICCCRLRLAYVEPLNLSISWWAGMMYVGAGGRSIQG